MTEAENYPTPCETALALITTAALDEAARNAPAADSPPPAHWEIHDCLTAVLAAQPGAGTTAAPSNPARPAADTERRAWPRGGHDTTPAARPGGQHRRRAAAAEAAHERDPGEGAVGRRPDPTTRGTSAPARRTSPAPAPGTAGAWRARPGGRRSARATSVAAGRGPAAADGLGPGGPLPGAGGRAVRARRDEVRTSCTQPARRRGSRGAGRGPAGAGAGRRRAGVDGRAGVGVEGRTVAGDGQGGGRPEPPGMP